MQRRAVTVLVYAVMVASVGVFVAWARHSTADYARRGRRHGMPMPVLYRTVGSSQFRVFPEPRLFATMATRVDSCVVSVRFIRTEKDGRTLETPALKGITLPVGSFFLVVQVYSTDPAALQRCTFDVGSLRAQDDTGAWIGTLPRLADMDKPVPVPNALVYFVRMSAPAARAQSLRRVEGALRIAANGGGFETRPFRIEGVPLPVGQRVYGVMTPRVLSPNAEARAGLPAGLSVVSGPAVERIVAETEEAPESRALPRQQLILAAGAPARMGIPGPSDDNPPVIQADPSSQGSLEFAVTRGTSSWRGRIWDNEPALVALPREPGRPRALALLRLSREPRPAGPIPLRSAVFPPRHGTAGGAIAGAVRVDDRPFGWGYMMVAVQARDVAGWSPRQKTRVSLNQHGRFTLPNVGPGEYRLEYMPSTLAPWIARSDTDGGVEEYLHFRYGADRGAWTRRRVAQIVVRAGQVTDIPALCWDTRAPLDRPASPAQGRPGPYSHPRLAAFLKDRP